MKRYLEIFMVIAIALPVTGCAIFSSERTEPATTVLPENTLPVNTLSPESGAVYGNPVEEFYKSYFLETEKPRGALDNALDRTEKLDLLQCELEISAHEMALCEARVSIGALGFDGDEFTASLMGAASGNGSMTGRDENYEFSFDYSDGRYLNGVFDGSSLYFTVSAEGGAQTRCWLKKSGSGWYSVVEGEKTSALIIKEDKLMRFAGGIFEEPAQKQTEESIEQGTIGYSDMPEWDELRGRAPYELIVDEFEAELIINN
jgi:hypothetical protein